MLARPKPLSPSGHVAVLAISSPSSSDRIEIAADHLRQRGLTVSLAENLYQRSRSYLAGTDDMRLAELHRALSSDEIDAFLFARGGYGAMRLLDRIDFDLFARNRRPVIGFSDLTALHQALAVRTGSLSFHGPMLNTDFHDGLSASREAWLWSMLGGEAPLRHEFSSAQVVSRGRAEGILFGGCLSLTVALIGTPYDFWIDDGIWFWEDVSEPVYRIDRMLTHLRLSGRLNRIRGVMIGSLKECGGNDPRELDELLTSFFADSGVPVVRDLPFGHSGDNLLLPIGAFAMLDTETQSLVFPEPAVVTG